MLLQQVLSNLQQTKRLACSFSLIQGDAREIDLGGISYDFLKLEKNFAYLALEQEEFPAHFHQQSSLAHLASAAEKSPSLVVSQQKTPRLDLPWLYADNLLRFGGFFAKEVTEKPFENMRMVGITGTKGKTTTTQLLFSIFEAAGLNPGSIGTLGNFYPQSYDPPSYLSNPLATDLYQIGQKMRVQGARSILMEITSHGAVYERNSSLDFQAILLTNLASDHLDFHGTVEDYYASKMLYFERIEDQPCHVLIYGDEPSSYQFFHHLEQKKIPRNAQLLSYGQKPEADYRAEVLEYTETYTRFKVFYRHQGLGEITLRLPGLFNVNNSLGAIAISLTLGLSWAKIKEGLEKREPIQGRFERVPGTGSLSVYIDYAHTADSLRNILEQVKKIHRQKLTVVFGCGGNRDKTKRPKMGEIASLLADKVILTNDNPRFEDPTDILNDIFQGIAPKERKKVLILADRKAAIEKALAEAGPNEVVLVAGKGHETYQIFKEQTVYFSDFETIRQYFAALPKASPHVAPDALPQQLPNEPKQPDPKSRP